MFLEKWKKATRDKILQSGFIVPFRPRAFHCVGLFSFGGVFKVTLSIPARTIRRPLLLPAVSFVLSLSHACRCWRFKNFDLKTSVANYYSGYNSLQIFIRICIHFLLSVLCFLFIVPSIYRRLSLFIELIENSEILPTNSRIFLYKSRQKFIFTVKSVGFKIICFV